MLDIKQHKIFLSKVLLEIYKDKTLSRILWFKWWTCAMFFYWLPRFSVDLDFDILTEDYSTDYIMKRLENILSKYWKITDLHNKHNTILWEFSYKSWEKKVKIEISKRKTISNYISTNFLWENIFIINKKDLFTNKLVALLHRNWIANRDIFDIWYFLSLWTNINDDLIYNLTWKNTKEYLNKIKDFINSYDFNKILYNLWDLLDDDLKIFCKNKMKQQILWYIDFYL